MQTAEILINKIKYEKIFNLIKNSLYDFSDIDKNLKLKGINQFDVFKSYEDIVYKYIFLGLDLNKNLVFIPFNVHSKNIVKSVILKVKFKNYLIDTLYKHTIFDTSIILVKGFDAINLNTNYINTTDFKNENDTWLVYQRAETFEKSLN